MGIKAGKWKCSRSKIREVFSIENEKFCSICGRPVNERYTDKGHRVVHKDLWSDYNGC